MKKISLGLASCLLLILFLFNSCAKEGPAGATGPAGPAGAAGPAGPAGVAGPAGTANVIYSEWLDVNYAIDTIIRLPNNTLDTSYFGVIPAPKLTAEILSRGEIKVYLNLNTAAIPAIYPLPYFDGFNSIQPLFYLQNIELGANANFGTRTAGTTKVFQYRYILIPGGVPARSMINWNNYKEVKELLNLPD